MALAIWSPVGLLFAQALANLGEGGLCSLHQGLWWLHSFLVIGFICSIPFTKFRHIFTTTANSSLPILVPKERW